MNTSEPSEIFCNYCKSETTHICKSQTAREHNDGAEWFGYKFWVCAGCGHGTLEQIYIGFWMEDQEDERQYFPPRRYVFFEPKEFKSLPKILTEIYKETLNAVNNKTLILGAIGIRALLEGICADKNIKGGNLEIKINNLSSILPQNIVTNLHSMRFLGNEAAHELTAPSFSELRLAIEICEDLLNFIYELDYKTNNLTQMRTKRKNNGNNFPF